MPDPRSSAAQAALSTAFSRAVDLSALRRPAPADSTSPSGANPGADRPYVMDVTDAMFEQVLQASARVPIVVDLWAEWCDPCKQLGPVLEKLAGEGGGTWILAKVDVEANPGIAQAFQVQSIPTVVALAGGRPVSAFSGAQPEAQVRQWLTGLIDQLREVLPGIKEAEAAAPPAEPEPVDPRMEAAADATERGDYGAASALYRELLAEDAGNEEASAALAWTELFARVAAAPADAVDRADGDSTDIATALAAADAEVAAGDNDAAFGRLVRLIAATSGEERGMVRDHLLALFALFATDDPQVISARRALAAVLY